MIPPEVLYAPPQAYPRRNSHRVHLPGGNWSPNAAIRQTYPAPQTYAQTQIPLGCTVVEVVMDAKLGAFRDLCRKASIETDPAELESLKDALRFMLHSEEIELHAVEKKRLKPN